MQAAQTAGGTTPGASNTDHTYRPCSQPEVFCDFEYRQDGAELILGCFLNATTGERVAIDFRDRSDGAARLALLQHRWAGARWFAYSLRAEITCFLVAGLSTEGMDWIDLMIEARQITGSHRRYFARKASLLATLEKFEIPAVGDVRHKEAMRHLILSTNQYTPEQWQAIVDYGWTDVEVLPALWAAIQRVHHTAQKPYSPRTAVFRADAVQAIAVLEHRSRGFPVDAVQVERVFANQKLIRRAIAERCNANYGGAVYRHNKLTEEYSFSFAGLEDHIASLPFAVQHWHKTPSGRRKLADEFLQEFCRANPYFEPLRDTLNLLRQLKGADLRKQVRGNFVKGGALPYHTITGRSQPMVRDGFIFNMAPWLRLLVRPEPGHVIVGADWSQQEIVIAAALSGDRAMANALASGDVYLHMAKMAGAVPNDATKRSHPGERQAYKSAQLGLSYGMGVEKLAYKIFIDLREAGHPISIEEAMTRAVDIIRWHRSTFTDYWRFVYREVEEAKQRGCMIARDGWTLFVDEQTSFTTLQNYQMQSNGGVILREALKALAREPHVELICSLHDALYVYCHEDDAEAQQNLLIRCMTQAGNTVLRHAPLPLQIGVETKLFTHETGFTDPRGTEMYGFVMDLLAQHDL